MLHKTRGIVLNYIKYKESSVIARIYTEAFGAQSYIINGVRSARSKKGLALLQPLTLLDLVVYYNQKHESIQRLSEYKPAFTFRSIPFDIRKSTISLFMTEVLSKVLKEEEDQGHVFEFLYPLIARFDQAEDEFESIHLYMMVHLTHYIGFGIHSKSDLERDPIVTEIYTSYDQVYDTIIRLSEMPLHARIPMSNRLRTDVLNYLVRYYELHIEGFSTLRSIHVLHQIFHR